MVEPWDFAIIAEAATSHMMATVHVLVVGFCDGRGDKTVPCRVRLSALSGRGPPVEP